MMKVNEIRNIIKREVKRKGYLLEERKSVSTDSWYFKIYSGEQSLMFRLSDHETKTNVITLRTDKKISQKSIKGFICNRCKDLGNRTLKNILGI